LASNKRALFIGRFQPFHLGHLEAIKKILQENDELIIVVGSAQSSHSLENPFTVGERIVMLRSVLKEEEIDLTRCYVVPLPDAEMHAVWVAKVIAYCPPFDIVYSNEPLTSRLFEEMGFDLRSFPLFRRDVYDATEIRRRICADEDWKSLVPPCIVGLIDSLGGVDRLKALSKTDKKKG
jgi:nicotinamide-nucleotide adenylyltransferase